MIFLNPIFVLILLNLLHSHAQGAITDEEAKNAAGEVVFHAYEGNKVNVANRHRVAKPSLKFSLHGTVIDRIEARNASHWTLHLHDASSADFSVVEKGANVTEYYLIWHGGGPNGEREICFSYGFNDAKWFNVYQSMHAHWPMDLTHTSAKQQFNFLFNYNRLVKPTHAYEHLFILEQLFLNSDGFAILLDYQSPLFIKRDPNGGTDPLLCFSVNNKEYPYMEGNTDPTYLDLKIHLFSSTNIRTVTDFVVRSSGYTAKPTAVPDEKMFTNSPSWFNWEINRPDLELAPQIGEHGFPGNGKFVMHDSYDTSQFGSMIESNESYPYSHLMSTVHDNKFQVAMQIHQVTYPDHEYIDLSDPEACKHLQTLFTQVAHEKKVDTFLLFASNNMTNFTFHDTLYQKYPSLLTSKYLETVTQVVGTSIISEYAFRTQNLPVWLRMSNFADTPYDQQLHELIPNILSISIAGYSFVIPYSVGGLTWYRAPTTDQMIRWIQAVTFMPSIALARLPWDFTKSTEIIPIFKKQLALHAEHVPVMLELAKKRITDRTPIIRPLWYVAPDDQKTYSIGDQYMLGDDILVAPVFKSGHTERHVYFPAGTWIDQHGKSHVGPGEVKIAVPLEELAYFKRKH